MPDDIKEERQYVMVVDMESKRPGCVLLQAAYGCGEANSFLQSVFDTRHWLLAPAPKMAKIKGSESQWKALADQLDKIKKHA